MNARRVWLPWLRPAPTYCCQACNDLTELIGRVHRARAEVAALTEAAGGGA